MESQLQRGPVDHSYDQDSQHISLHSVVEDEGGKHDHDEKKSVLKKVKAKAKKIKDSLIKHGHGHEHEEEHEGDYAHGDRNEDEEDDEDEEMVEDPEVHGAPTYESAGVKSAVPAQSVNLDKPRAIGEERYDAQRTDKLDTTKPVLEGQSGENLGRPSAMEVVHASEGLEEDHHAPRNHPGNIPSSNYETKTTDPTGKAAEEVGTTPLLRSFDKMSVHDESGAKSGTESRQEGYTGSHDQFAPQPNPTQGEFDTQGTTPKSYDPSKPEDLPRDTVRSPGQSGYVDKISVATSIIADKAISAKNAVASKLGYGATAGAKAMETGESKDAAKSAACPTEYAHKVAATVTENLAPVYEKVADTGSSVMSKVKGSSGTGHEGAVTSGGGVPDKGVSVKEQLAEKLKPSEEDKALSEVISETLLHKKKEEGAKAGESKPMGKVTESEEVVRHLGTGREGKREGDDAVAAGRESSGKSVVDRLKGAVSSWIGKGGEEQYSQGSPDTAYVSNEGSKATGELQHQPEGRKLQESGN